MKQFRFFAIVLFTFCLQPRLTTQETHPAGTGDYLITRVSVVDVEKGTVRDNATIEVRNGLIERILSTTEDKMQQDRTIIDGKGLFVIPGLFDAHVHYYDPAVYGPMMIAHGVLFVREMGNATDQALALRQGLKDGAIFGPEMTTTGSMLDGDPPTIPQISIGCGTPEAGREAVRKQVAAGVDELKVYSGLKKDVFLAIVDEARKCGIKIVGHVPESVYIEDAAAVGMRSGEHLFGFGKVVAKLVGDSLYLGTQGMGTDVPYLLRRKEVKRDNFRAVLKRIAATGMVVCPTLVVFKHGAHYGEIFSGDYPMLEYASPAMKGMWSALWGRQPENPLVKKLLPSMEEVVKEISLIGIPLMVGTDLLSPGVIPGYSVHEEMELWQDVGIPPADILRSATIVPAKFVGVDNRLGTVAEGKAASFVLVRSNPLDDIRNVEQIEAVCFRGRFFSRTDLDALLEGVKKQCGTVGGDGGQKQ